MFVEANIYLNDKNTSIFINLDYVKSITPFLEGDESSSALLNFADGKEMLIKESYEDILNCIEREQ